MVRSWHGVPVVAVAVFHILFGSAAGSMDHSCLPICISQLPLRLSVSVSIMVVVAAVVF